MHFTQFLPMVASCKTAVLSHSQDVDSETVKTDNRIFNNIN